MSNYLMLGAFNMHQPVKFTKDAIKGTSRDPQHLNWLPIQACRLEPSKSAITRSNAQRHSGGISCERSMDISSAAIVRLAQFDNGGRTSAIIDLEGTGGPDSPGLRLRLGDVAVTSYRVKDGEESFILDFDKIEVDYWK
jgi:type VI protein secretion system component Hcp